MKLSQLNSNKPKMETIQALNDGADEEDFKQLLEILIRKDLNEEEKEIFDKVIKAMNAKSVTASMLNLAFWAILLYVSFAILPLWAAISLIGIKLAIPVAKAIKYITVAKKLIKDDKDVNKKILSIRLKIANKEK